MVSKDKWDQKIWGDDAKERLSAVRGLCSEKRTALENTITNEFSDICLGENGLYVTANPFLVVIGLSPGASKKRVVSDWIEKLSLCKPHHRLHIHDDHNNYWRKVRTICLASFGNDLNDYDKLSLSAHVNLSPEKQGSGQNVRLCDEFVARIFELVVKVLEPRYMVCLGVRGKRGDLKDVWNKATGCEVDWEKPQRTVCMKGSRYTFEVWDITPNRQDEKMTVIFWPNHPSKPPFVGQESGKDWCDALEKYKNIIRPDPTKSDYAPTTTQNLRDNAKPLQPIHLAGCAKYGPDGQPQMRGVIRPRDNLSVYRCEVYTQTTQLDNERQSHILQSVLSHLKDKYPNTEFYKADQAHARIKIPWTQDVFARFNTNYYLLVSFSKADQNHRRPRGLISCRFIFGDCVGNDVKLDEFRTTFKARLKETKQDVCQILQGSSLNGLMWSGITEHIMRSFYSQDRNYPGFCIRLEKYPHPDSQRFDPKEFGTYLNNVISEYIRIIVLVGRVVRNIVTPVGDLGRS